MGYETAQKGYKLYNLEGKTFFVNRDVVFVESVFPFKDNTTSSADPVSNTDLFNYDEMITIETQPTISHSSSDSVAQQVSLHQDVPTIRKSARSVKPPIWHKDYITTSGTNRCLYSITSVLDYSGLSNKYQSFISKFSVEKEPATYEEAIQDVRWVDAMQSEIKALEDNQTWELVDLPRNKKAIGRRWVYKVKYNSDGGVERFKAL